MADADSKAARAAYQKAWREAHKDYFSDYYKANRERIRLKQAETYKQKADVYKERAANWAKANPGRRCEIADKYRAENPDIYRQAARREYERNKEAWRVKSKEYRSKNPDKMRELNAAWHAQHPEANAYHVGLRRTRQMQATPAWANLEAVKAFYKQAARLRRQTGLAWHVDHDVPLKHSLVCGLHNEFNLQVIPGAANQSKGNRFVV